MAGRIRSIKPEVLDDEEACGLSDAAWRLWISSWCLSDDHGNLRASDKYLAAQTWQDTNKAAIVPELLRELVKAKRFEMYENGEERYVHIRNWEVHQRVDNAGKPRVPGPDHQRSRPCSAFRGDSPRLAEARGDSPLEPPLDHRPPISDHRSPTTDHTRARVEEPPSMSPAIKALVPAWTNAGLHGTLGGTDPVVVELAKEVAKVGKPAIDVCRAWLELITGMQQRGVMTKQKPAKMLEHLRTGMLVPLLNGTVTRQLIANGRPNGGRVVTEPPKMRVVGTREEELAELERNQERLNRLREERGE